MDSVTHVFLGGVVAQCFFGKRLGGMAFLIGGLGATMPDFDVFIHTGDVVRNHVLHRHFTHSLVMVPVLAALAVLPFMLMKRLRGQWQTVYAAAVVTCATHGPLDMLTSYGTMILWPFTERRFTLDIVAAVDLVFTLILIVGAVISLRRRTATAARIALVLAMAYLGVAAMQHGRAVAAQRELLAMRGHEGAENPRVLPQLGAVLNYRSIYVMDGRLYADGIRVMPFAGARVKAGTSVPQASMAQMGRFRAFWDFADGFVASVPGDAATLGDMRYTTTPEGFEAVWGVMLDGPGAPMWRNYGRVKMIGRYWKELAWPAGYVPLAELGRP